MNADEAQVVAAAQPSPPRDPTRAQSFAASTAAVFGKESRWRMRGRRAFVIVAVYVALLALFELLVAKMLYDQATLRASFDEGFGPGGFASGSTAASIGQVLFGAILSLQMVLVMILAPALSSSAISIEREKQTLELLITTPVSTLGMIIGKLFASLAYVFLLIAASIPLMALVFVFGGIAPEDVVRAYILLAAVAVGLGAVGMFMSALFKRTQVATALALLFVLLVSIGSLVVYSFIVASNTRFDGNGFQQGRAPPELLVLNPIVAVIDVGCTAIPESGFTCAFITSVTNPDALGNNGGFGAGFVDPPRDAFWPRVALAYVVVAVLLTLATTQLIAPSRRIRRRRPPVARPGAQSDVAAAVEP